MTIDWVTTCLRQIRTNSPVTNYILPEAMISIIFPYYDEKTGSSLCESKKICTFAFDTHAEGATWVASEWDDAIAIAIVWVHKI